MFYRLCGRNEAQNSRSDPYADGIGKKSSVYKCQNLAILDRTLLNIRPVICPELETLSDNHWNSMEINGRTHWPLTNFNDPHCNLPGQRVSLYWPPSTSVADH